MSLPNVNLEFFEALPQHYRTSGPTRDRRNARRQDKDYGPAQEGGKRGAKSTFTGMRMELIQEFLDDFVSCKGGARNGHAVFWHHFFALYWSKFNWQLPLDREPDPSDIWKTDKELTPEEIKLKEQVTEKTQRQLKTSITYLANSRTRKTENPWALMLTSLKQHATCPTPRQLAPWQHYMGLKDDDIDEEFAARWPAAGLEAKDALAFRGMIARELLAKETDEYKMFLQEECVRLHKDDLEKHDQLAIVPEALTEEQARAIARAELAPAVQPLLEIVADLTGYHVSLLCRLALPDGPQEFQIKVINAGKTDGAVPMTWHKHEGERFHTEVLGSFTRYLAHTAEYRARLAHLGTAPGPATSSEESPGANTSTASTPALSTLGLSPNAPPVDTSMKSSSSTRRQRAKSTQHKSKRGRKRGGRGGGVAEETSEEEFDDMEEEEDDEDEDEDEREGDGCDPWDLETTCEVSGQAEDDEDDEDDGQEAPCADELGLNDAVKAELAALAPKARRRRLLGLSCMSEYDRQGVCMRAQNAATMRRIEQEMGTVNKPKPKPRPRTQADPSVPRRQSSRLNPGQIEQEPTPTTTEPEPTPTTTMQDTTHTAMGEQTTLQTPMDEQDAATAGEQDAATAGEQSMAHIMAGEQDATHAPESKHDPSRTSQDTTHATAGEQSTAHTTAGEQDTAHTSTHTTMHTTTHTTMHTTMRMTAGEHDAIHAPEREHDPSRMSQEATDSTAGEQSTAHTTAGERNTAHITTHMNAGEHNTTHTTGGQQSTTQMVEVEQPMNCADGIGGGRGQKRPREVDCADVPEVGSIDDSKWPAWLREAYDFLIDREYGSMFKRAVGWWVALERVYGLESGKKGLGTAGRPEEVGNWMRLDRRKLQKIPAMKSRTAYVQGWWSWWTQLQPAWRQHDLEGHPILDGVVAGGWGKDLCRPGRNGVLLLLLSLVWWKEAASDVGRWDLAVHDVAWVIAQMAQCSKESLLSDDTEVGPRQKKNRT